MSDLATKLLADLKAAAQSGDSGKVGASQRFDCDVRRGVAWACWLVGWLARYVLRMFFFVRGAICGWATPRQACDDSSATSQTNTTPNNNKMCKTPQAMEITKTTNQQ